MKVLLIVLGSLFGLALIAIIGLAILVPKMIGRMEKTSHDPAAQRAIAAKVANFTLPPGYRIASASDFGLSQTVIIRSSLPEHRTFSIQLTGQHVPVSDTDTAFNAASATLGFAAKFAHCDLTRQADDDVVVRGKSEKLRVLACSNASVPMRVEMGFVQGTAPTVQIVATDVGAGFDQKALHELLTSFK